MKVLAGYLAAAIGIALLSACGVVLDRDRAPSSAVDVSSIRDAVPRVEPKSRYGNPRSYVVNGKRYFTLASSRGFSERGIASWYGQKFHGRRASSGETYDMYRMTAAHKTLPLPTYVSVRHLSSGREIVVRVNDRGPFHANRIIDLSYAAAVKLGIARKGTGLVEVRALTPGSSTKRKSAGRARGAPAGIFIQAGAFRESGNASRLKAGLAVLSRIPVQVRRTVNDGRAIFRVWLGPVSEVDEADRIVNALSVLGIVDPQVIVE